jgi:NTE family protein
MSFCPRLAGVLALLWLALVAAPLGAQTKPTVAAESAPARPRVGLVLSGGGARGLAHVGVLKVLERERIPIDVIAGTSMGAIVGGLYASGMSADDIEREFKALDWDALFAFRVDRQHLSQRRKEEDFEIAPVLELGLRGGELRAPTGAVSSRGLEMLLRRFTMPVRRVQRFDDLHIPFRAVATDLETGAAVVLDRGDLALALRSSMSVPGVFPPTEWQGRVLGDGGLVNNLPVDVARAMGADVVIAVNVGTPVAGRETLNSALGVATQMITILTEQNVQRSIATLKPDDVLIGPALGTLSSGDFDKSADAIAIGERGAQSVIERLRGKSVDPAAYARWQQRRALTPSTPPTLDFVEFAGSELTNPARFSAQLESQPGRPFDTARAERDARTLAASGDYTRTDYRLINRSGSEGLVFELEDKPWGPNYLRLGLDLSTDFNRRGSFNLKLSHNRHWLTPSGTEWRNRLQIGAVPLLFTELYHPLNWSIAASNDWFVAGYAGAERRTGTLYTDTGDELARYNRTDARAGVDLGQPWGRFGELRLGWAVQRIKARPTLVSQTVTAPVQELRSTDNALRAAAVIDQLNFASFPTRGYRLQGEASYGRGSEAGRFQQLEGSLLAVKTFGRHTVSYYGLARGASQQQANAIGRYSLGGFHQLSGYNDGQLLGNYVLLSRLSWYTRLPISPVAARAYFVGATVEGGNAWATRDALHAGSLRAGFSAFFGADTGLGPLYLAVTHAPLGGSQIVLFIGRP